jgi:hypothetical protein
MKKYEEQKDSPDILENSARESAGSEGTNGADGSFVYSLSGHG